MTRVSGLKRPKSRELAAVAVVAAVAGGVVGQALVSGPTARAADGAISAAPLQTPASFAPLVERVAPAVVSVVVERETTDKVPGVENLPPEFRERFERFGSPLPMPQQPQGRRGQGAGSGFVIDDQGHIVTNHHVVAEATSITVRTEDGRSLTAELVGTDPRTDLAVLKVEGAALPHLRFGDSDALAVGDWVVAVGNPFGLGGTVTAGIVSARGRDIGASAYGDFLQIDAPINRGNSGGPTFDQRGEVIGINTAIIGPMGGNVGIGFAIPANLAKPIVDQLIADGEVTRGWLGVSLQPLDDVLRDALGIDEGVGVLVADVVADSPAEAAGFRRGDVVVDVDGAAMDGPADLSRRVGSSAPGSETTFTVIRKGNTETLTVRLGAAPKPQAS